MKAIRVTMSEVVTYQFIIAVADAEANNESIGEVAEKCFVENGPKDEWVLGISDRDLDSWEEIELSENPTIAS